MQFTVLKSGITKLHARQFQICVGQLSVFDWYIQGQPKFRELHQPQLKNGGWLEVEDGLKPILLRDLTRLAKQPNFVSLMLIGKFYVSHTQMWMNVPKPAKSIVKKMKFAKTHLEAINVTASLVTTKNLNINAWKVKDIR